MMIHMDHDLKNRAYKSKQRKKLGLHRPLDEYEESSSSRYIAANFARLVYEFTSFIEYVRALDEADILLTCDEDVPEPLKSNLISVNNRLTEDENKHKKGE